MSRFSRRTFIASTLAVSACSMIERPERHTAELFVCPPCGCSMDDHVFKAPGRCPDCGMTLTPKKEADLGFEPSTLAPRAGRYEMPGRGASPVVVHYYLPDTFTSASPILLVLPGAGRNSRTYRDRWIAAARSHGVLVAALGYREEDYDLAAYHYGGIVTNLRVENRRTERPNDRATVVHVKDEDIRFEINRDRSSWIFGDFDRIFDHVVAATGSRRTTYDIFGHSAGGQVLHRMAILHPDSKAGRIIAANAGSYTLPDLERPPLFGLAGLGLETADLAAAFRQRLTLLLGEEDNGAGAGGTLLRTPVLDRLGLGRIQRGRSFHAYARRQAASLGVPLNWTVETVPNVGHDGDAMSQAAARLLYPTVGRIGPIQPAMPWIRLE